MIDLVDTGTIIKTYLEENGKSIKDLAKASKVSCKTVYRIFNNEVKLSYEVANGIHKLIPEISTEFLMTYDTKYRLQIKEKEEKYGIEKFDKLIEQYQLKQLYPDIANDENALIKKGISVFNFDNIEKSDLLFNFDLAKNSKDFERRIWVKASYYDYIENNPILSFDKRKFNVIFDSLLKYTGTSDIYMTLYNIAELTKECGINFFYRGAIKNSRIRGVTFIKDSGLFLFLSDLFKCVERIWITFVHELIHINNGDYSNNKLVIDVINSKNEEYIDDQTIRFFISKGLDQINNCDLETVNKVANENDIPLGIAAYLVRSITKVYNNYEVNNLIHYFSADK